MRVVIKRVITICLVATMAIGCCTMAYAEDMSDSDIKEFIAENVSVSGKTLRSLDVPSIVTYLSISQSGMTSATPIQLKSGAIIYYDSSNKSNISDIIQKYNERKQIGTKVKDISDGFNLEADTYSAASLLSGFSSILSLGLGIICSCIIMFMTLFTALDVCYISFPIFRNKCEEIRTSDSSGFNVKQTSDGGTKFRWVTDDAMNAIKNSVNNNKNPWMLYLKSRVVSYIFLAVILFVLVTGNISVITEIALKAVSGIINVMSGLK